MTRFDESVDEIPFKAQKMPVVVAFLDFVGHLGLFAGRPARRAFLPPLEWEMIWEQIGEVGRKYCPSLSRRASLWDWCYRRAKLGRAAIMLLKVDDRK